MFYVVHKDSDVTLIILEEVQSKMVLLRMMSILGKQSFESFLKIDIKFRYFFNYTSILSLIYDIGLIRSYFIHVGWYDHHQPDTLKIK